MKKEIRKEIISKRMRLSDEEIKYKSLEIKSKLENIPDYVNTNTRLFYVSFKNEVETKNMIKENIDLGKRIIIPVVIPGDKNLLLSEIKSLDELNISTYGILEPKKEYIRPVSDEIIEVVIVPGVAFDESGYRIGYGGGYYDRLLKRLTSKCISIALAFEMQIIERIPHEEHDMKVDMIITEKRIVYCKK